MLHDECAREVEQPHEQRAAGEQDAVGPLGRPARGVGQQQVDDRQVDKPLTHPPDAVQGGLAGRRQRGCAPQQPGDNQRPGEAQIAPSRQIRETDPEHDGSAGDQHGHGQLRRVARRSQDHDGHRRDGRQTPRQHEWKRADQQAPAAERGQRLGTANGKPRAVGCAADPAVAA